MSSAGRILIIPKGEYNENETYEMLDLVSYNGVSWIAKKTVVGIAPSDGEYWHNMFNISGIEFNQMKEDVTTLKNDVATLKNDVSKVTDIELEKGVMARKIGRQVTLYFDGYQVNGTSQGNGGNIGNIVKPMYDVIFPLVIPAVGLCVGLINTAGYFSLYNADQSQYISGSVSGTVSYMTSEPNVE